MRRILYDHYAKEPKPMGNTMAARVFNSPLVCVPIDTLQGTISDASKAQSIQSKLNIQTLFRHTHEPIAHIPRARSASPHAKQGDQSDAQRRPRLVLYPKINSQVHCLAYVCKIQIALALKDDLGSNDWQRFDLP